MADDMTTFRDPFASAVFCNRAPADAETLRALALRNYGHFTTMQVRDRAVRGFRLHLARLRDATRQLFGVDLDDVRVRDGLRHAFAATGAGDCTARVTIFSREFELEDPAKSTAVDVLVSLAPPAAASALPLRVRSVVLDRPLPHLKHVATLPLLHARREARRAGFDDALLLDATGRVCEGSIWNVGFFDGARIIWPQAPMLRGTTQQLLEAGLAGLGIEQDTRPVGRDEIVTFSGAFATYSRGIEALAAIDGFSFGPDPDPAGLLGRALALQAPEPV